ncbi:alpha/beta fold hydrolase [Streptomyces thermolilacinus]|uniref:alpha/beta fold hydrolase n=1 Tax=Streptomyces thermolilacinus TaxID=285540 RepID=UPI000D1A42FD
MGAAVPERARGVHLLPFPRVTPLPGGALAHARRPLPRRQAPPNGQRRTRPRRTACQAYRERPRRAPLPQNPRPAPQWVWPRPRPPRPSPPEPRTRHPPGSRGRPHPEKHCRCAPPGLTLSAKAYGNPAAPGILFVHGLGRSSLSWHRQVEHLAARLRLVTFDMRGHGASSVPDSPDAYADGHAGRPASATCARPPASAGPPWSAGPSARSPSATTSKALRRRDPHGAH